MTHKQVDPPICPYCGEVAMLKPSTFIYGRAYGTNVWVCRNFPQCNAFVGAHKNGTPLGTLANKALRKARTAAHEAFDPLWFTERLYTRQVAYMYLAGLLGMTKDECHIGMMGIDDCQRVIDAVPELRRIAQQYNFRVVATKKQW